MVRLLKSETVLCILLKDLSIELILIFLLKEEQCDLEEDCFLTIVISIEEELLGDPDDLLELIVFLLHNFPD
jgi:hypothetical protein